MTHKHVMDHRDKHFVFLGQVPVVTPDVHHTRIQSKVVSRTRRSSARLCKGYWNDYRRRARHQGAPNYSGLAARLQKSKAGNCARSLESGYRDRILLPMRHRDLWGKWSYFFNPIQRILRSIGRFWVPVNTQVGLSRVRADRNSSIAR